MTRVYSGDITEEVYQRWQSLFSVRHKGLVKAHMIKYDTLVFGAEPDMRSLSLDEKKRRIRECLTDKKGRCIGHHKVHTDLPVFAGYYCSSKQNRGSLFTRIYRDDITKEMQEEFPDLIRNYNRGMISLDQIRLDPSLSASDTEDVQLLGEDEKRQRISDYIASTPEVPTSQESTSALSCSTGATGEVIVVETDARRAVENAEVQDAFDHGTQRDINLSSLGAHHTLRVHVGSWCENPRVPVHAYKPRDESIIFQCYLDQCLEGSRGPYEDLLRHNGQIKIDAVILEEKFRHATAEGAKDLISLALERLAREANGSNSRISFRKSMMTEGRYETDKEAVVEPDEKDTAKGEDDDRGNHCPHCSTYTLVLNDSLTLNSTVEA